MSFLPGKHANIQIPKVTGLARRYELTGNTEEKETAYEFRGNSDDLFGNHIL